MIGRISPPRELEEKLDVLTTPMTSGEPPLFETKQKALMFAAALGRRRDTRTKLDRKGVAIRHDVFERVLDDGYLNALAVGVTQDLTILSAERSDERIAIFEEYAHTGLIEIISRCLDQPGDPLEELLAITEEVHTTPISGLSGMDANILRKLMEG